MHQLMNKCKHVTILVKLTIASLLQSLDEPYNKNMFVWNHYQYNTYQAIEEEIA